MGATWSTAARWQNWEWHHLGVKWYHAEKSNNFVFPSNISLLKEMKAISSLHNLAVWKWGCAAACWHPGKTKVNHNSFYSSAGQECSDSASASAARRQSCRQLLIFSCHLTNLRISLFFCCCLVLVLLAIILPGKSSVLLIIGFHTELSKQS